MWRRIGMKEIVFEVAQEADGGFVAEALGESIFTQGDTWDELRANVREAVQAFYFDSSETWGAHISY
jgi:predicted RNase H-like HicB family nuclease